MSKFAPHRRSANNPRATSSTVCQKCLGTGHFIYECKSTRPYVSRPSRTQQLDNPKVLAKLVEAGKPSVEVPDEFKKRTGTANQILEAKEQERQKERDLDQAEAKRSRKKRSRRSPSSDSSDPESRSSDSSDTSSSDSDSSDSDSSDTSSSDSDSSNSDSSDTSSQKRRRRRSRKRRRR